MSIFFWHKVGGGGGYCATPCEAEQSAHVGIIFPYSLLITSKPSVTQGYTR